MSNWAGLMAHGLGEAGSTTILFYFGFASRKDCSSSLRIFALLSVRVGSGGVVKVNDL